jgi:predicted TIM-barrel fold metal-dependent hydrolase
MSDLKKVPNPVWDRFFEFVFPCDEQLTRTEVQSELRRLGIDVKRAVSRVHQALASSKAREDLDIAKANRAQVMQKLEHFAAPVVEGLRENLRALIAQRFQGTVQAAYFRKLETAASDADLQSLLEDIHRLEALSEGPNDAGSPTK